MGGAERTTAYPVAAPPLAASATRSLPRLEWTTADGARTVTVERRCVVGSAPHCDVIIADPAISRVHAEIEPRDEGVWIRDLNSRNGTFVEGVRVESACVLHGFTIRLGGTDVVVNYRNAEHKAVESWPSERFGPLIGESRVMRFAREHCRGLDVEVLHCDYRDVRGTFDKIAAVAMFTHVGSRNYGVFMRAMARVLEHGGALLIEGVWGNKSTNRIDPWTDKYIFPGAMIPSGAQVFRAFEGLFVAEDVHNFGPDYVKTLRAWNLRLHAAWPRLQARHDDRVRKTFEYFFLVSAGYFRARTLQHWHLFLTKPGTPQPRTCRLSDAPRAVAEIAAAHAID